jgi:hypothetical protein
VGRNRAAGPCLCGSFPANQSAELLDETSYILRGDNDECVLVVAPAFLVNNEMVAAIK